VEVAAVGFGVVVVKREHEEEEEKGRISAPGCSESCSSASRCGSRTRRATRRSTTAGLHRASDGRDEAVVVMAEEGSGPAAAAADGMTLRHRTRAPANRRRRLRARGGDQGSGVGWQEARPPDTQPGTWAATTDETTTPTPAVVDGEGAVRQQRLPHGALAALAARRPLPDTTAPVSGRPIEDSNNQYLPPIVEACVGRWRYDLPNLTYLPYQNSSLEE